MMRIELLAENGMYLRFTLTIEDSQSLHKQGIIIAAVSIMEAASLEKGDDDELRAILKWFNENLKVPKILDQDGHFRALSWFRPQAREPILKAWELSRLLQANGYLVEVHKSRNPGRVIYEDEDQIVAICTKEVRGTWR